MLLMVLLNHHVQQVATCSRSARHVPDTFSIFLHRYNLHTREKIRPKESVSFSLKLSQVSRARVGELLPPLAHR